MKPNAYQIGVTPGVIYDNGRNKTNSKFTNGTLDFLILTKRDGSNSQPPSRLAQNIDRFRNANSGKLKETFFDSTKTGKHHGIMAFARDLIFDSYLYDLMKTSLDLGPKWGETDMPEGSMKLKTSSSQSKSKIDVSGMPPSWKYKNVYSLECSDDSNPLFKASAKINGMRFGLWIIIY
jgi:hypothetical protein